MVLARELWTPENGLRGWTHGSQFEKELAEELLWRWISGENGRLKIANGVRGCCHSVRWLPLEGCSAKSLSRRLEAYMKFLLRRFETTNETLKRLSFSASLFGIRHFNCIQRRTAVHTIHWPLSLPACRWFCNFSYNSALFPLRCSIALVFHGRPWNLGFL